MEKYKDVLPDVMPEGLSPRRPVDHKIELLPSVQPPKPQSYPMLPELLPELKRQLEDLVKKGHLRLSQSPYGASVMFVVKSGGGLRLCGDFRALNKLMVRNRYPLPCMDETTDRLVNDRYYSKLDLKSDYHQIQIAKGDERKTTINTQYGQYEFTVLPFGLCNAPRTFCNLMNQVFRDLLDICCVVYLDNIIVYSSTWE